jgi:hypothetical protein
VWFSFESSAQRERYCNEGADVTGSRSTTSGQCRGAHHEGRFSPGFDEQSTKSDMYDDCCACRSRRVKSYQNSENRSSGVETGPHVLSFRDVFAMPSQTSGAMRVLWYKMTDCGFSPLSRTVIQSTGGETIEALRAPVRSQFARSVVSQNCS